MDRHQDSNQATRSVRRIRLVFGVLMVMTAIFLVRLFYIQVIRYDHFHEVAMADHLKKYTIPANRGVIKAHQGDSVVPIVLNEKLFTIYADPFYIKDPSKVANTLAKLIGGKPNEYQKKLDHKDTRYVVLKKRVDQKKKQQILNHKFAGIGAVAQTYRTYPNGDMAAQLLGFVNDNGQGQYGIEQSMNNKLTGKPGKVKAVTDIRGVPLAANSNNIVVQPEPGDDVVLTLDIAMQKNLESIVKQGKTQGKAKAASALILDMDNGAVKAMANYPSYNPAKYYNVSDTNLFKNSTVSHDIEIGSIMKALTVSAALDKGVVKPTTSFYDPGHWTIDNFNITDVEASQGEQTMASLLNLSLNTGATWLLMQMGGGEINSQARKVWHNYMTHHFLLGQKTKIQQPNESNGFVPSPKQDGKGINLTYANTTFGQALTATPLQMAAATASALNGGTYYKPRLVDRIISSNGQVHKNPAKVVKKDVVKPSASDGLEDLMNYVIKHHDNIAPRFDQAKYTVGGKTGTAQIAKPNGGGYYDNQYNATYLGFVGGSKPKYAIVVFVFDPDTSGYRSGFAGSLTAQPIFVDLAHMLINNGYVAPKN